MRGKRSSGLSFLVRANRFAHQVFVKTATISAAMKTPMSRPMNGSDAIPGLQPRTEPKAIGYATNVRYKMPYTRAV